MNLRTRKLIGMVGTVLFLVIYSLVAMAIGGQLIVGTGQAIELIFYIVAGIAWLPIVMLIISWMSRPGP